MKQPMPTPSSLRLAGRGFLGVFVLCAIALSVVSHAEAQTNELQSTAHALNIDSGRIAAPAIGVAEAADEDGRVIVHQETIHVDHAPWLRLQFGDIELAGHVREGTGAVLRITSLEDGGVQRLDAATIQEWRSTSAYFNGDAVTVELLAFPESGMNRLTITGVTVGEWPDDDLATSICFGEDERELSFANPDARALPIGCTAYLIDGNSDHCFLTAGHCVASGSMFDPDRVAVVEFNPPLSNADGSINFAPPSDQYATDPDSFQFQNNGCSQDWSYFGAFTNSTTGLAPAEAQEESYQLAAAAPSVSGQTIRIRGYGSVNWPVPLQWNAVQKEHDGPYIFQSGTDIRYQTDTTGGNSGSAVYMHEIDMVIGVHTCGGCGASGGANRGTAIQHPPLQSALSNPMGICTGPLPPPANNECQDRIAISDGETSYTTSDATTEGPNEPALCDFFSNTQIQHDVWYEYEATCSGEMTVSLCNSSFPTKLGIYEGSTCPSQPDTIAACDTISCPANTFSEITMPVTEGETFIIRIGGRVNQTGSGMIDITCDELATTCPEDLTGTGTVGTEDLFELLAEWGECPGCAADLNGDNVVDTEDLFELLAAWGECQ